MNKTRQRTLVAPTIRQVGELAVDSHLVLSRGLWRISELLKLFINKYRFANEECCKDDTIFIQYLADRFEYEQELGLQDKFSKMQHFAFRKIIESITKTGNWDTFQNKVYDQLYNPFFMTACEYFGKVVSFANVQFDLAIRRRPKRHHFQRYVGVGYNDKGTSTELSRDGTPSWQLLGTDELIKRKVPREVTSKVKLENLKTFVLSIESSNKRLKEELKFHFRYKTITSGDRTESMYILMKGRQELLAGFETDVSEEDLLQILQKLKVRSLRKKHCRVDKISTWTNGSNDQVVFHSERALGLLAD